MAPATSSSSASTSEKSGLPLPATDASSLKQTQRRCSSFTMRASILTLFGLIYLCAAFAPRVPCNHDVASKEHSQVQADVAQNAQQPASPAVDEAAFAGMLDSVSPERLHKLLHSYLPETYQHGVYESDRHAVEMLRKRDARLATSLLRMAKRQNNSTSAVTEPSSTEQTTQLPSSTDSSSQSDAATTDSQDASVTATTDGDSTITEAPTTLTSATSLITSESVTTFTSTDANGNVQIVTSTAMVVVRPSGTSSSASATSTADLQNAASRQAAGVVAVPAMVVMAVVGGLVAL
ncbi:hypothetical protein BROUX41_002171 [Berkeleyomyces rouxiae]|uniref:uncharacterized protein n=1 Tax=Berkeleyomyces rouxiae TaxID=2035830 RepID=UPI003B7E3775